jgi:hypothetical protein
MHKSLDFEGAQTRAPYQSRRELLKSTRLSRLPSLPKRPLVPDFAALQAAPRLR